MTEENKAEVSVDAAFDVAAGELGFAPVPTETSPSVETIQPEVKPESIPEKEPVTDKGFFDGRFKTEEAFTDSYKGLQSRADKAEGQNKKLNETIDKLTNSSKEFMTALGGENVSPELKAAYAKIQADRLGIPLDGFNTDSQLAMIPAVDAIVSRLNALESGNAEVAAQTAHDAEIAAKFPHVDKVKADLAPLQVQLAADGNSDEALLGAHQMGVEAGNAAGYAKAKAEMAAASSASLEPGTTIVVTEPKPKLTPEQARAAEVDEVFKIGSEVGHTFS